MDRYPVRHFGTDGGEKEKEWRGEVREGKKKNEKNEVREHGASFYIYRMRSRGDRNLMKKSESVFFFLAPPPAVSAERWPPISPPGGNRRRIYLRD